jgi:hypothetical protein
MLWVAAAFAALMLATPAAAQTAPAPTPAPAQAPVADDPDLDFQALQPDFTLVNLPTTLRLARNKSSFRVTHRFTRPLGQGSFGSLAEDFFSIDSSALIGLEYRFGLMRGLQVGIRRTNDRTIEFFTQYSLMDERSGRPFGLGVLASIDGTNNMRDSYSPSLGAVLSRSLGRVGTVYLAPMWVNNTNPLPSEVVDDNDTFVVGVGTRIRLRRTVYVVAEVIPRVAGDDPGANHASVALEKVVGGHAFQVNFSNGFATSVGPLARGGVSNDDWFLGFNISRKFF